MIFFLANWLVNFTECTLMKTPLCQVHHVLLLSYMYSDILTTEDLQVFIDVYAACVCPIAGL